MLLNNKALKLAERKQSSCALVEEKCRMELS